MSPSDQDREHFLRRQANNLAVRKAREKQNRKIEAAKQELEHLERVQRQLKLQLLNSKVEFETLKGLYSEANKSSTTYSQNLQHQDSRPQSLQRENGYFQSNQKFLGQGRR